MCFLGHRRLRRLMVTTSHAHAMCPAPSSRAERAPRTKVGRRPVLSADEEPPVSRILVIEDDLAVGKVLTVTLQLAGHDVRLARDVYSARGVLEGSDDYDAVVLDVNLPDGSGFDILRLLRQDLGRETPVLVLSALKQEENVIRALELGANDYVTKPFGPRELLARIRKWTG
jgi:CheY-like chemotaxis protein